LRANSWRSVKDGLDPLFIIQGLNGKPTDRPKKVGLLDKNG